LRSAADAAVLEWAASEDRQVFSRDHKTMIAEAWYRVAQGVRMPGLFVIPEDMPIGQAVRELEMIVLASEPDEWRERVIFMPL